MTAPTARILVVDDEPAVRTALRVNLAKAGYDVQVTSSAEEATEAAQGREFDVVLTDVKMPGESGLALLESIKRIQPETRVILMTGHGSVEDAVTAMRSGASDYII
ncbi:MAG: DNA-binding NtrC family response regulator, partial [Myxococcota bacterium]